MYIYMYIYMVYITIVTGVIFHCMEVKTPCL